MDSLIPVLASGIAFGFLYALMGTGLVLIYRGSKVINFAYGAGIGLLAYITDTLLSVIASEALAIAAAFVVAAIVGYAFRVLVVSAQYRPSSQVLRARGLFDEDTLLKIVVATIGVSLIIEGAEPAIWGNQTRRLPISLPAGNLRLGGIPIPWVDVTIIIVAGVAIALIGLLLGRTRTGFNVRALFSNPYAANLFGMRVGRSFTVVWIIGTVAGLLAALMSSSVIFITPTSYITFAFTAFIAIVLGGLESLRGALLGGLIVGVGTALVDAYISPQADELILLAFTLVVLFFRPQGLLSSSQATVGRL